MVKLLAIVVVTPFVGVWIETHLSASVLHVVSVTPFVGVWIETNEIELLKEQIEGHTLRGCVD